MDVYVFSVGMIDLFSSQAAIDNTIGFIKKLPGFCAVHPDIMYTMLCFDTLENAITSRGMWTETGNNAARFIMNATIDHEKGMLIVKDPAWDSQGGPIS